MTDIQLSRRGADAPESPIRALAARARARSDAGIQVHYLNIGQPDVPTPKAMVEAYRSFDDEVLAYAPSDGYHSLRAKLATWYGTIGGLHRSVDAEDIVVTTGGSEALLFAMAAVTDPDDSIIVCEPYYTNYSGYAHMLGIGTTPVTCIAEEDWAVDPAAIEAAITPSTRAVVLPTPGNPTGRVLAASEIDAIATERWLFAQIQGGVKRTRVISRDGLIEDHRPLRVSHLDAERGVRHRFVGAIDLRTNHGSEVHRVPGAIHGTIREHIRHRLHRSANAEPIPLRGD